MTLRVTKCRKYIFHDLFSSTIYSGDLFPEQMNTIKTFQVTITDHVIEDFLSRLKSSRLHSDGDIKGLHPGREEWAYGTSTSFMQKIKSYATSTSFNWKRIQNKLNERSQFTAKVPNSSGTIHKHKTVHFMHETATDGSPGIPLLLLHGWPSTPYNFIEIIPLLTARGFNVVAPSIPGYAFSEKAREPGFDIIECSHVFQSLMVEVLGYSKFIVQGGDWGSIIGRMIATHHQKNVLAYHTNMPLPLPPTPKNVLGDGPRYVTALSYMGLTAMFPSLLSKTEQNGLIKTKEYPSYESGYAFIQGTKPQTLGYGLNDSPLGLLAWIGEKDYAWSDHDGELKLSMDQLLTTTIIYWATNSITSSMRLYYESSKLTPYSNKNGNLKTFKNFAKYVSVPTGILVAHDIFQSPRKWLEYSHNVVSYTDIRDTDERGGHFLKMENPSVVVNDICNFVFKILGATKENGVAILEKRRLSAIAQEKVRFFFFFNFFFF